jgi:hypothetical protein
MRSLLLCVGLCFSYLVDAQTTKKDLQQCHTISNEAVSEGVFKKSLYACSKVYSSNLTNVANTFKVFERTSNFERDLTKCKNGLAASCTETGNYFLKSMEERDKSSLNAARVNTEILEIFQQACLTTRARCDMVNSLISMFHLQSDDFFENLINHVQAYENKASACAESESFECVAYNFKGLADLYEFAPFKVESIIEAHDLKVKTLIWK